MSDRTADVSLGVTRKEFTRKLLTRGLRRPCSIRYEKASDGRNERILRSSISREDKRALMLTSFDPDTSFDGKLNETTSLISVDIHQNVSRI